MERYSDYQPLGTTKSGPAFRALDTLTKQPVLVKQIPKDGQGAFPLNGPGMKQSAGMLTAPKGFSWVSIIEIGEDEYSHYVVSEFLQAPTASQHPEKGTLTSARGLDILNQLVTALVELERVRLTHGDIKPSNVLLPTQPDGRPQVKLTDCGLCRFRQAHPPESMLFSAPERLAGGGATIGSDLFSAAHVVYFLLTGFTLTSGTTMQQITTSLKSADPTTIKKTRKDLDGKLVKILLSLLEQKPEKRPSSALAVQKELAALKPPGLPQPTSQVAPTNRLATTPGTRPTVQATRPVVPTASVPIQVKAAVPLVAMRPPPEVASKMGWKAGAPPQSSPTGPLQTGPQLQSIPVAAWTQPMGAPQQMVQPNTGYVPQGGYAPQHPYGHPGYAQPVQETPKRTGLMIGLIFLGIAILGGIGAMLWMLNSTKQSVEKEKQAAPKNSQELLDRMNQIK